MRLLVGDFRKKLEQNSRACRFVWNLHGRLYVKFLYVSCLRFRLHGTVGYCSNRTLRAPSNSAILRRDSSISSGSLFKNPLPEFHNTVEHTISSRIAICPSRTKGKSDLPFDLEVLLSYDLIMSNIWKVLLSQTLQIVRTSFRLEPSVCLPVNQLEFRSGSPWKMHLLSKEFITFKLKVSTNCFGR